MKEDKENIKYPCGCILRIQIVDTYDFKERKFAKSAVQKSFDVCINHADLIDKVIKRNIP